MSLLETGPVSISCCTDPLLRTRLVKDMNWFVLEATYSRSSTWLSFLIRGRSFRIFSTLAIRVKSASSSIDCSSVSAANILCMDLIIRSHMPPVWLANGALKFHEISFLLKRSLIFVWDSCAWSFLNSSFKIPQAPTKLVLLSLKTSFGTPRRATKRLNAQRKD